MNDLAYSGVNTTVRILEQQLLTADDLNALLMASNLESALELLRKTNYDVIPKELLETKQFDDVLNRQLKAQYQLLYDSIPIPEFLDLFSIRYTYHNLKVLLKEKFSKKNFKHLLIPIGRYSIDTLIQLVETKDSPLVPAIMIEAVAEAYSDFENFGRLETADIFMDTYYFKHLRYLSDQIKQPQVEKIVSVMIDLENIATLIRASLQHQSRSFLQTVLSNVGTVSKTQLIDAWNEKGWESLVTLFDEKEYQEALAEILSQDRISVLQLELLKDDLIYQTLKDATFESFGPYPSLAYIHACEMEVRNLRLLLVGKDNDFSEKQLKERMRPVYDA